MLIISKISNHAYNISIDTSFRIDVGIIEPVTTGHVIIAFLI